MFVGNVDGEFFAWDVSGVAKISSKDVINYDVVNAHAFVVCGVGVYENCMTVTCARALAVARFFRIGV